MQYYLRNKYPNVKTVTRENWDVLLKTASTMKGYNDKYQYVVDYIGIEKIRPFYPLKGDLLELSKRIEDEHLNGLPCVKYWDDFFPHYTELRSEPIAFVDEHLYTKGAILHEMGVNNTISCAVCTIKQAVRMDLINANLWEYGGEIKMKVKQIKNKNQFEIIHNGVTYFQSYKSLIAKWGTILTLGEDWNYSQTTLKHLYIFMQGNCWSVWNNLPKAPTIKASIQKAIDMGIIIYDGDMR